MQADRKMLNRAIGHALSGKGAHVEANKVFSGLNWKLAGARPEGASHSPFQVLNHMIYWQHWVVKWLDGEKPSIPRHASGSWPGGTGPASPEEWQQTVRRFQSDLEKLRQQLREADLLSKRGKKSPLEMLQTIAAHNSYHAGQVVLLRQMLGAWPPLSGGLTW